jgi:hypothetical protein
MTEVRQSPLRLSDTSIVSVQLKSQTQNPQTTECLDENRPMEAINDDHIDDSVNYRLQQVDSEDLSTSVETLMNNNSNNDTNTPFYKQLLQRMNPTECLSPTLMTAAKTSITAVQGCTTTAYKTCVATDREELELVLNGLLKDIKYKPHLTNNATKSTARTVALQRLYRLTDREHAQNRYV